MRYNFIGKTLAEVEFFLKKEDIEYIVTKTVGGKDEDILKDEYIVCVRDKKPLELIVSKFKTDIADFV